jgi:pimeloyl-ACP methyl ester carboxylesterase
MRKWFFRISFVLVFILISGLFVFAAWGINGLPPASAAQTAMQGTEKVSITETGDQIIFMPKTAPSTTGFIFYPGARVLPAAYAPNMILIAEQGYPVFIVKMPVNFAIFGINRAADVVKANPAIKTWAIGGHSLGGSMASVFVSNSDTMRGIVFWASYPAADLSKKQDLQALSIFGSLDGVLNKQAAKDAQALLPPGAQSVIIEGGNHAYFGWYGVQDGDNPATIDHVEATKQIADATIAFLKQITPAP